MRVISIREHPNYKDVAIQYFQKQWSSVDPKIYEDTITHCIHASNPLPQWYLLEKEETIIGCAGLITNDFISRGELYPWLCALFIDETQRGNAYAALLMKRAMEDTLIAGFNHMYLSTEHIGYYEKYDFEFIGIGHHPWNASSRIYKINLFSKPNRDFPICETKRLLLDAVRKEDLQTVASFVSNKKLADMTLNIPHPYKIDDAIYWYNNIIRGFNNKSQYTFAIREKSQNALIGAVGLKVNLRFNHAEMGYWMGEPYWNNGYITEAVKEVINYGFNQLGLQKIFATHLIENPASGRVMQKAGMIKEGELIDHVRKGDEYKSLIQYRITKSEFNNL